MLRLYNDDDSTAFGEIVGDEEAQTPLFSFLPRAVLSSVDAGDAVFSVSSKSLLWSLAIIRERF